MEPTCWLQYYLILLQRKIISRNFDSLRKPIQWSLRRSIVEAEIGIILWLQHQPCGELDIILHPCRLRAFKCNVNHQNQSNCCGDMNSKTLARQKEDTEQFFHPHQLLKKEDHCILEKSRGRGRTALPLETALPLWQCCYRRISTVLRLADTLESVDLPDTLGRSIPVQR